LKRRFRPSAFVAPIAVVLGVLLTLAPLLLPSAAAQSTTPTPQSASPSQTKAQRPTPAHPAAHKKSRKKDKKRTASRQDSGPRYATRSDVMQQADRMAQQLHLDRAWVRHTVGQARYVAAIAKAVLPPAAGVAKNWTAYHDRFVEPQRIEAGVRFWQANREALARAQEHFGVPPSIVVGIIGVESFYGRHTGNYRIADALCTLAFDFPSEHPKAAARSAYFRSELEAYLTLMAQNHTDPLALRGSYAGAMGWPQFMPSSWTKYAIDFAGDGHIDLFNNQSDMIGSVANYFQAFHWQAGQPTHFAAQMQSSTSDLALLMQSDIVPSWRADEMAAKGVQLDAAGAAYPGPLALIQLENGDAAPVYVAGTSNFYAITRYNWSAYYAMAVIDLGQAVADAMNARSTVTNGMPK